MMAAIITDSEPLRMQEKLNKRLKELVGRVKDVKFSTTTYSNVHPQGFAGDVVIYSVLVLYEQYESLPSAKEQGMYDAPKS